MISAKLCPVDSHDPIVNSERNFVLQTGNNSFLYIPNINRGDLRPYVTHEARIIGTENPKYNTIEANKLEVMVNGKWHTAWSQRMENHLRWEEYDRH